jgi:hypothetical protein
MKDIPCTLSVGKNIIRILKYKLTIVVNNTWLRAGSGLKTEGSDQAWAFLLWAWAFLGLENFIKYVVLKSGLY